MNASQTSTGLLLLRLGFGGLMLNHGIGKLIHFSEKSGKFMEFMGLSSQISLGLVIFAEVACATLIILGLFTRLATIPLIITMLVAIFIVHLEDPFQKKEMAILYLIAYVVISLMGPGTYSVDEAVRNKRRR